MARVPSRGDERAVNWISIEYLELLCERSGIAVNCIRGDDELWITELGPHPSHLTAQDIEKILRESSQFEIYKIQSDRSFESFPVPRTELESKIRQMVH